MQHSPNDLSSMKIAGDIVIAFLSTGTVASDRLAGLVREVHSALTEPPPLSTADHADLEPLLDASGASRAPDSAGDAQGSDNGMTADESITPDYLISFEDGKPYRSLKRHLMARYGMTPEAYRSKWRLPATYPMVAPNYARQRSDVAKRIGLGGRPKPKTPRAKRPGVKR